MKFATLLSAGLMLAPIAHADTGVEPVIVCRVELPPADDLFAVTVPVADRWIGEPNGLRHADVMQPPRPRPDWIDGGGKPRPVTPAPTPVPLPGASALIGAGIAALGVLAGIRRMA